MAVDDVSFYNLIGEEISRGNLVSQMIDFYSLKLDVGETKVTDFNEGSEIRNLLEAFAVDLYILLEEQNELTSIGFIDSAEGEWLDKHGVSPFINLPRDTGSEATGFVTFSIPESLAEETIIEEGTIVVSEEDGISFSTDGEGVISAGETSCIVPVTCLTTGLEGNVSAGDISIIDDDYIDIPGLSVTNAEEVTGGTDYEEDEEYRERLLAYIRQDDFGSMGYYNRLGQEINGVHDVLLVDTSEINPVSNKRYTKKVLVNGDVKPVPSDVLVDVVEEFSAPEKIVVGHSFKIVACERDVVDLTVNLTMKEEIEDNIILSMLQTYFDGGHYDYYDFDGLYIDDRISNDRLVDILTLLEEIINIEILYQGEALTEIVPETNHVLQLGTVTINQTVQG